MKPLFRAFEKDPTESAKQKELSELIHFLTSDSWPFHGVAHPTPEGISKSYEKGVYSNEGSQSFWILNELQEQVGLIRIYELEDDIPLFDLRISSKARGQGLGEEAVKWLVHHIFSNFPEKMKLEAFTRKDNFAMRTVFYKSGFVKEAYHRQSWPDQSGQIHDSVGYGITRDDWNSGTITQIDWADFKY